MMDPSEVCKNKMNEMMGNASYLNAERKKNMNFDGKCYT